MAEANEHGYAIPPRYWAWVATPRTRVTLAWLIVAWAAIHHVRGGRQWMANEPTTPTHQLRPKPGGHGYTQIDFGGQWVMGRMLVLGHGRELYHRQRQWEVVRAGYPVSAETPEQQEAILPRHLRTHDNSDPSLNHDADSMMWWFMGRDPESWQTVGGAAAAPLAVDANPFAAIVRTQAARESVSPDVVAEVSKPAIGGPLYPPIHAFIYAPLGLFENPQDAYYLFQFLTIGFAVIAARGLSMLTRGVLWWPVATAAVLLYPGCRVSIDLGQNPTLTLCIAVWGWILVTQNREWTGGAVWGLFAFKPVWGLAFFLVPLVMGRWRVCVSMVATGAGLAALTLPVTGLQTWFDWLAVGKEAAELYNRSLNWINLSRDIQGIPRRFLHDFTLPEAERETPLAKSVAWGLWGIVFAGTVIVYRLRADRTKRVGLGAAFLFLGAWATCYRFMYYDVLLSIVGVACLAAEPARLLATRTFRFEDDPHSRGWVNSLPLTVIALLYLLDNWLAGLGVEATVGVLAMNQTVTKPDGTTVLHTPRLVADSSITYPWDTALVLLLWAWCGWRLLRGDERHSPVR
ncbi:MAG: glycosyltransferase family 87 protein [Gemmataceae bacterium]